MNIYFCTQYHLSEKLIKKKKNSIMAITTDWLQKLPI